jgi:acetyl esterase
MVGIDTHEILARQIANESDSIVIIVDYRLAPEFKFPTAIEDAFASLKWVVENDKSLGIDTNRLAVGGDSAGGNLAAVTAIFARDHNIKLKLQFLVYPATDLHMKSESYKTRANGYLLTATTMEWFINQYLRNTDDRSDWRASPTYATNFADLPPTLIITAGFDPLCAEGEEYAKKLEESGVQVTFKRFPGQMHGFILQGRVIPEANDAISEIANAIRSNV